MNFEGVNRSEKTPIEDSKLKSSDFLFKRGSRTYLPDTAHALTRSSSKANIVLHPKRCQKKIDLFLTEEKAKIDRDLPPQTPENQFQLISQFLVKNCKKFSKSNDLQETINKLSWLVFAACYSKEICDLKDSLREQTFLMEPAKQRLKKLHEACERFLKKEKNTNTWSKELIKRFQQIDSIKNLHLFIIFFQDANLDKKTLAIFFWAIGGNCLYITLECLFHETFFADLAKPITPFSFEEWKKSRLPLLTKVKWHEKKKDFHSIEKIHSENVLRSFYVEKKVITEAQVNGIDILGETPELFMAHLFKEFVKHGFEEGQNSLQSFFKQESTPYDKLLKAVSFSAFAKFDTLIRTTFPLIAGTSCYNIKKDSQEITKSFFFIKNSNHFSIIKEVTYFILIKEKDHWMSSQGTSIGEIRFRCKASFKAESKRRWKGSLKIVHLKFHDKAAPSLVKGAVDAIWQGLPDCRDPKRIKALSYNSKSQSRTLQNLVPKPQAFPLL